MGLREGFAFKDGRNNSTLTEGLTRKETLDAGKEIKPTAGPVSLTGEGCMIGMVCPV